MKVLLLDDPSGPVLRYRETISAIPPPFLRHGFRVSHCGGIGWDALPLACDTPPCKSGISAILAPYHMKLKKNGCDTASVMLSPEGNARQAVHLGLGRLVDDQSDNEG